LNAEDILPDYVKAKVLVLGCGNMLFGDDGFGVEFARYYDENSKYGEDVVIMDAHTSVRKLLFNILISDVTPQMIIVVDAVDKGKEPGDVFEIELKEIPENKKDDFSMHQAPTSDLLAEIKDLGKIEIRILVCQVESIPEICTSGLSEPVQQAIPKACEIIDAWIKELE